MAGASTGWRLGAAALAWLAGVAFQLQERSLARVEWYAALLGVGMCGLAFGSAWLRRWSMPPQAAVPAPLAHALVVAAALAAIGLAGFGAAGWQGSVQLAESLASALEGDDLELVGVVAGLPQRAPWGVRFRLDVEQASRRGEPVRVPRHVLLGWSAGYADDAALTPAQRALAAGERWRFAVRLRAPHGTLNPHGFDHELLLFEQGVRATGSVREAPSPERLAADAGHPVERARQRVRDAIERHVGDRRAAGVLAALAVGDQSAIEREDWELFRQTGIAHLVSISGLHVTMFAWVAGLAVSALWRRSSRAMLRLPAPVAARWGGLAAAAAYALFSGGGVPAQRTVWMLATVTLLQSAGRRWPWPLTWLAAAVVVTACDPWALLQAGFWLSFVAVGLLMASGDARFPADAAQPAGAGRARAAAAWLRAELRGQVVATLGLAPLSLVCFQQVSLVGFVANLVAIPVVTLLVTPLALLGVLALPLWSLGAWLVQRLCAALAWLAAGPGAVWTAAVAPGWAQLAGVAAALVLVLPWPWRLRALAVPLAVPLLVPPVARPPPGGFDVLAADVGQGTAVLVRTHRHLLVYDAGPQYARDSDAGQRVLVPLLRARGERRIDRLVLSHRDTDHVGGARALLEGVAVSELTSSLEERHPLRALGAPATRCVGGQSWQWDGVRFEMLQPPDSAYARRVKPNALSCVLRVEGRAPDGAIARLLLTGDIERDQEGALVVGQAERLRAEVLLAPHHGSRTSSTAAFLDLVQPRIAVVQAGYRNRFGHPAPDVLARYAERGIRVVATPHCGAWRWAGDARDGGVCERDASRRYWHHAPMRPRRRDRRRHRRTDPWPGNC